MDTDNVTFEEFRTYIRGAVLAFVLLTVAIGYALTTKPDVGALRAGDIGACNGVNTLRAQSNISNFVSFRILSLSAQREFALGKKGDSEAKLHAKSAKLLFSEAKKPAITALTDCKQAVDNPRKYHFPTAGPIGDPMTGKPTERSARILTDSQRLLGLSEDS